jgi:hypothetical protein
MNKRDTLLLLDRLAHQDLILVVETVALGSVSMIHIPLYGSDSESEPTSDSEDFTSSTSDVFQG